MADAWRQGIREFQAFIIEFPDAFERLSEIDPELVEHGVKEGISVETQRLYAGASIALEVLRVKGYKLIAPGESDG